MPRTDKIRRAFEFLRRSALERTLFSAGELAAAAGWTELNTHTNLSKRLSEFVCEEGEQFRAVSDVLTVDLRDFESLFHQKQRMFADYSLKVTPSVLVYEFFMPMTHEAKLRRALDHLFYRDAVEQRVRALGFDSVRTGLGLADPCTDAEVMTTVTDLVEGAISGYSMYMVSGRFRMAALASHREAAARPLDGAPYLMDETTAVVRFILPVEVDIQGNEQMSLFELVRPRPGLEQKADQLRWVFLRLFAEPFVRVVREEEEIWLLESGMRSAVYRWVRVSTRPRRARRAANAGR